jgi:TolA-binding protein
MRRSTFAIQILLILALPLAAGGCFWVTTKAEGKSMRRKIDQVDEQVMKQEQALPRLQQVLDEATKLLARNSADLGNQVTGMETEMKNLNGLVQEAKRLTDEVRDTSARQEQRISALEQRLAELENKSVQTQKTASQLWDEGQGHLKGGRYEEARTVLRQLLVKYPGDERADDAQMTRGETYFKEKKYQESLGEFQRVFEKYPDSPLADDSAFRAGEAAEQLKWCTDARAYFGLLIQRWPKSNLVKKAKDRDAGLKKAAKDKKKCQAEK